MKLIFPYLFLPVLLCHLGCGGVSPTQSEIDFDITSVELRSLLNSAAGRKFAQAPWDVNNDREINTSDLVLFVEHVGEHLEIIVGSGEIQTVTVVNDNDNTIQVTGLGSAMGEPDIVTFVLGVSVEKKTVTEARKTAAEAMKKVIDSLEANGVADSDMQTKQYSIQQQFDYINNRRVSRGYNVTNIVSAILRELDRVPNAIDDATKGGAQMVQVQSIQFGIENSDDLKEVARIAAMENALDKAKVLAAAGAVELGRPIAISEASGSIPSPIYGRSFDGAEVLAETPIESGQLRVTVSVNVVYAIR